VELRVSKCRLGGAALAVALVSGVHTRAQIPDRAGPRNGLMKVKERGSCFLRSAAGDGSIRACSFRSPISHSRLCCGCWPEHGEDLRPTWPVILVRGLPDTSATLRRFQADSGAGSARDERKPAVVMSNTSTGLQDFYGSDGTRTRDLRRDRPVKCSPSEMTDGARLQGFPRGRDPRTFDERRPRCPRVTAKRRAYPRCTRGVPACCMRRRLEMPICRHLVEAL
jgi:hypothetical protein